MTRKGIRRRSIVERDVDGGTTTSGEGATTLDEDKDDFGWDDEDDNNADRWRGSFGFQVAGGRRRPQ